MTCIDRQGTGGQSRERVVAATNRADLHEETPRETPLQVQVVVGGGEVRAHLGSE